MLKKRIASCFLYKTKIVAESCYRKHHIIVSQLKFDRVSTASILLGNAENNIYTQ